MAGAIRIMRFMNLVNSREALSHAPEVREPGAELLADHPERYVASFRGALPAGVSPLSIRRVAYLNFANDPCSALLLQADDGADYLMLNELGPDAHGEVERAGLALSHSLGVPYAVGAPEHWPRRGRGFLARLFGYAA